MSERPKLRLLPFAHNVRVASFRVDQIPSVSYWLTKLLLFPSKDELFFSFTDTDNQCTILIEGECIESAPREVVFGRESFCAVRFHEGDLGFDVSGIVDAIATPLAQAGIPVLYVSSFSTDIFMVEEHRLDDARVALERSIFEFVDTATLRKVTKRSTQAIAAAVKQNFTPEYLKGGKEIPAKKLMSNDNGVVVSKLPWELRMGRLRGNLQPLAAGLLRLCLFPENHDRFFSLIRFDGETALIFEESERLLAFGNDYCQWTIATAMTPSSSSTSLLESLSSETSSTTSIGVDNHHDSSTLKKTSSSTTTTSPTSSYIAELSPTTWRCLLMCTQTSGYNESGIMARFTKPLAAHGVSIFKVTTVSNDYSLVRTTDLENAIDAMRMTFDAVEVVEEERNVVSKQI